MNREQVERTIRALNGNRYTQATGSLKRLIIETEDGISLDKALEEADAGRVGYCCLGVAIEAGLQMPLEFVFDPRTGQLKYESNQVSASAGSFVLSEILGIPDRILVKQLMRWNDEGTMSFRQIANELEWIAHEAPERLGITEETD